MYEQFYGFDAKPFNLSPDPRFFFESQGHARALAYLHYGVEQGEGFVVVTGDVGTGKTTLARMLYEDLQRSRDIVMARTSVPHCTGNELLKIVADAYGIKHERRTKATLLRELFEFFCRQRESGRRALLLVDEVQNLPPAALETLRSLSNLQADDRALLQIILLGQAEFRDKLNANKLRQLRQRVLASCHLMPFAESAETRAYIEHRLGNVGWSGNPSVSEGAYEAIHEFTAGTPRRINTFCDRLLLFAYLEEQQCVTEETVAAVIEEISGDFPVLSAATPPGYRKIAADGGGGNGSNTDRLAQMEVRVHRIEAALERLADSLELAPSARPGKATRSRS